MRTKKTSVVKFDVPMRTVGVEVPVRTFAGRLPEQTGGGCRGSVPGQALHDAWPAACWRPGPRAQRNPMFLFRFSGSFLFRFAERRFLGSLLYAPPRSTRVQESGSMGLTAS